MGFKEFDYPILEKNPEGRLIKIKAGKEWVEDKAKKYEGFTLSIPSELGNEKEIVFAVLSISQDGDGYKLGLHAHSDPQLIENNPYDVSNSGTYIDLGGDAETDLQLKRDFLKNITELHNGDLDFLLEKERKNIGSIYNVLAKIPRKVIVKENEITIIVPQTKPIDVMNVCSYIFNDNFPID